jgi:hypothetical protein
MEDFNAGEFDLALSLIRLHGDRAANVAMAHAESLWARGEMPAGERWFRVHETVIRNQAHERGSTAA